MVEGKSSVDGGFLNSGHFVNLVIFVVSLIFAGLSLFLGSLIVFCVPVLGVISIVISFIRSSLITLPLGILEIVLPFVVVYFVSYLVSLGF